MVQVAWLTCPIADSFERTSLALLSTLLLGNPAAPLYRALMESRLGQNLAPSTGYQDDYRETYFAAGLQGTDPECSRKGRKNRALRPQGVGPNGLQPGEGRGGHAAAGVRPPGGHRRPVSLRPAPADAPHRPLDPQRRSRLPPATRAGTSTESARNWMKAPFSRTSSASISWRTPTG